MSTIHQFGRTILRPTAVCLSQSAGAKRGPPRFLGRTKSQVLDKFVRSNAVICALASFTVVPFVCFWVYRYVTVLKPQKAAWEAAQIEELLAEGKAPN